MVQTRQQSHIQQQIDQLQIIEEFQRLSVIEVEQTNNLSEQEHIVYRPISFVMSEKLINTILSHSVDKLLKFGGKNNENVNKWLTDIIKELDLVNLNDPQKFSVIQTFLVDDARRWFLNNKSRINDWSTFVLQIQKTFSSPMLQELALKKVGSRQQGLDETVLHYYNDMMELFAMIDMYMTDQYKVKYLKAGLKVSLKKEVMRKDPTSAEQFLEIAQTEEKLDSSTTIQMDDIQSSNIGFLSTVKSSTKSDPQQQQKSGQSFIKSRCYRCNRVGHYARDCFSKNY
jgi:hypothetical protein